MPHQTIKIQAEVVLTGLNEYSDYDDLESAAEAIADELDGVLEQAMVGRIDDDCSSEGLLVSTWVVDQGSVFDV